MFYFLPTRPEIVKLMHRVRWVARLGGFVFFLGIPIGLVVGQESGAPAAPASQPSAASSSSSSNAGKHGKQKYSHANDFLIHGTVFTDKARSFPGVELRIRRAGEKKIRWRDYTNSRGEFAMRVPQGREYEMLIHAKGFADQSRTFDAKRGLTEERVVFTMEPAGEKK